MIKNNNNLKKILCSIILFIILMIPILKVNAKENLEKEKNIVNLYFFHSNSCSHCNEEKKLLTKLEQKYPNLKIYYYEVSNEKSKEVLLIAKEIYDIKTNGVPITIIGEEVYLGYNYNINKINFIKTIEYYSNYGYQDK